MPKLKDRLRAEAVSEYFRHEGSLSQAEFCAAFEARTGRRLSPRTLRSWIARFGASGSADGGTRALLADALDQVRTLADGLQAALDRLDGEAAAPMPARHVEASNEPLPPAATSAVPVVASADPVGSRWAAAAALPPGTQVIADANELISTNSFWD